MSVRAYLVTENAFRYNDEGCDLLNDPQDTLLCPHRIFRTLPEAHQYIESKGGAQWHVQNCDGDYSGPSLVILEIDIAEEAKLTYYETLMRETSPYEPGLWYALNLNVEDTSFPEPPVNFAYPTRRLEEVATLFGTRPYGVRHLYQTLRFDTPELWKLSLSTLPTPLLPLLAQLLTLAGKPETTGEVLDFWVQRLDSRFSDYKQNHRSERDAHPFKPWRDLSHIVPTLPTCRTWGEFTTFLLQHSTENVGDFAYNSPEAWASLVASLSPLRQDALQDLLNTVCLGVDWEQIGPQQRAFPPPSSPPPHCIKLSGGQLFNDEGWAPLTEDPEDPRGLDWFMGESEETEAWEALVQYGDPLAPPEIREGN